MTAEDSWETLRDVEEGIDVSLRIDDFENQSHSISENPRTISGQISGSSEDVSHSAGEIQRVIAIGDPWGDGCYVDLGDTAKNNLSVGGRSHRNYSKAWRPRPGQKGRCLLGRVVDVEVDDS